jgi:hypothetical protein
MNILRQTGWHPTVGCFYTIKEVSGKKSQKDLQTIFHIVHLSDKMDFVLDATLSEF